MNDHPEPYVTFAIGADRYALPAVLVRGIHDLPELTRVEAAPAWVAGTATLAGELVPVLDFDALCGIPGQPWRIDGKILVLGQERACVALHVSEVGELLDLPGTAFAPLPAAARSAAMARFMTGQSILPGTRLTVLDGVALLALGDEAGAGPLAEVPVGGRRAAYPDLVARLDTEGRERLARRAARLARADATIGGGSSRACLVFRLGRERFVLEARVVQELARVVEISAVPCAPVDVVGHMNLRGEILTLIDVGRRLGLARSDTPALAIVVAACGVDRLGLTVDAVEDVFDAHLDDLEPAPPGIDPGESGRLRGLVRWGDVRLPLLDAEQLIPECAGGEEQP